MSTHQLTALPYAIKFVPKGFRELELADEELHLYGFDLDHTLIQPKKPGSIFARGASDWKFMKFNDKESIVTVLRVVKEDPHAVVVIFTNQGGVITIPPNAKSYQNFTGKIKLMLKHIANLEDGDVLLQRLFVYASTKKPASIAKKEANNSKLVQNGIDSKESISKFDIMRKPETGMAELFIKDLEKLCQNNHKWQYYCGDAAGRPKDFSDADKKFAEALNIEFKMPEDVFHGEPS